MLIINLVKTKVPIPGVEPFVIIIYTENLLMTNMNTSVRIEISTSFGHENNLVMIKMNTSVRIKISTSVGHENSHAGTQLKGQLWIYIQSMPQLLTWHSQLEQLIYDCIQKCLQKILLHYLFISTSTPIWPIILAPWLLQPN